MRVFFPLQAYFPSQIGGPCNTLYWHNCELAKHGFSPVVLTSSLGIQSEDIVQFDKTNNFLGTKAYYSNNIIGRIKKLYLVFKYLKNSDVLHLNSLFSLISIYTFFVSRFFFSSKPVIWSVRGELNSNALIYSNKKKKIVLAIYQLFSKRITFHATSEQEVNDIKTVFSKSKIILLPNYIKVENRYTSEIENRILFVGRIHPIKGLEKLIKAISLSLEFRKGDFVLSIVGKHEDRHEDYFLNLKKMVADLELDNKVQFLGHIEGEEKHKMFASSYLTVLPSETENFGNVVVESLNQGTPVIASLGTPWELLAQYDCGSHCSNDPLVLAQNIDSFLNKKEEYIMKRENAIALINEKFNIETQIFNWIDAYFALK